MSGNSFRSGLRDELYELKCIIDDFPVGAVSFQNVSRPSDDTELSQTVNLLHSKIMHLNVFDNIQELSLKDDRDGRDFKQLVHSVCSERIACLIVKKKAVEAGLVAKFSKSVMQRASGDELKKKLLQKLKLLITLVRELEDLQKTLKELKTARLRKELQVKEELSHFSGVVDKMRECNYPPENVLLKVEQQINLINKMRKLINFFLLGPGTHLNGKWLDVLYQSRNNVELNEFFN